MEKLYSINQVLQALQANNILTKVGKRELIYKDVWNAFACIRKKHACCDWIDKDYFNSEITLEGYWWIVNVYFNPNKKMEEAEINFFCSLIKNYQNYCVNHNINVDVQKLITNDMTFREFADSIGRNVRTVKNAYYKLPAQTKERCYHKDGKTYMCSSVCLELFKTTLSSSYLKYLENVYLKFKTATEKEGVENIYE